ncbi:MAG TPA: hypothetical protein PKW30_00545 [Campylobacterales bacterium]|nr:hypothetical protein [Campylobacterales bacterium]
MAILTFNYLYGLYLENYTPASKQDYISQSKAIKQTLSFFQENQFKDFPDLSIVKLLYKTDTKTEKIDHISKLRIKNIFEEITKKDKQIRINDTVIYLELYKIIWYVLTHKIALEAISDEKYFKSNMAAFESDQDKIFSKYRQQLRAIKDKELPLNQTEKGKAKLRAYILLCMHRNKELTKFFLNCLFLDDITKIQLPDDMAEELVMALTETVTPFIFQKTNDTAIVKSFAMLVYFTLHNQLGFTPAKSKELSINLTYEVFNTKPNLDEIRKYKGMVASVGALPIFACSKEKSYLSDEEKAFHFKKTIEGLEDIKFDGIDLLPRKLDLMPYLEKEYKIFIENPVLKYIKKYPLELFRKNPKYSEITN